MADVCPVAYDVDTRPGTWVAAQAARRSRLVWAALAAFFLADALFVLLVVRHRLTIVGSLLFLALVVALKPRLEQLADDTRRWVRGARAEEAVGATLNELRRESWVLMHDVEQAGEGNIDHIASGPNGIYLIETKERRYKDTHLTKAKRQAAKLHGELGVWVTPVICLACRTGTKPFRTRGVWIVPRERLLDWLRAQRNRPVPFERLARFADRIDVD